jgi:hypothetical protein
VTERRITEVEMLQLVRVSEKNKQHSELECTTRWQTPSIGIPEILDTEANTAEI